jgi:hypothetical protein
MNRKVLIAVAEVDNPWFAPEHPEGLSNPRKVAAALRPDALQWMARRDKIKPHQVAAGVRFGKFWELREGLRSGGLHEYVDLGRLPTIYDDVIDAGRELRRCQAVLSKNDYWLVSEVCGRGQPPRSCFTGNVCGLGESAPTRIWPQRWTTSRACGGTCTEKLPLDSLASASP